MERQSESGVLIFKGFGWRTPNLLLSSHSLSMKERDTEMRE